MPLLLVRTLHYVVAVHDVPLPPMWMPCCCAPDYVAGPDLRQGQRKLAEVTQQQSRREMEGGKGQAPGLRDRFRQLRRKEERKERGRKPPRSLEPLTA